MHNLYMLTNRSLDSYGLRLNMGELVKQELLAVILKV